MKKKGSTASTTSPSRVKIDPKREEGTSGGKEGAQGSLESHKYLVYIPERQTKGRGRELVVPHGNVLNRGERASSETGRTSFRWC